MCTHKYPYEAQTIEELQQKVLKEKYSPIPTHVNKKFSTLITKCLSKKPENRPEIEEIILLDVFQEKCKLIRITLPLDLNKAKII